MFQKIRKMSQSNNKFKINILTLITKCLRNKCCQLLYIYAKLSAGVELQWMLELD